MGEQKVRDFKSSWMSMVVMTGAVAFLGFSRWDEWRTSVPAPGLFAAMGFVIATLTLVLAVWFALARAIDRDRVILMRLMIWMLALMIAVGGLALYAFPDVPIRVFYTAMIIAGLILVITNPFRRR